MEVQKPGWFLQRGVTRLRLQDPLRFDFEANRYGPYSHRLTKLLDGSCLCCDKRIADASSRRIPYGSTPSGTKRVHTYLHSGEGRKFADALT